MVYIDSLSVVQALGGVEGCDHIILSSIRRLLRTMTEAGFQIRFCWIPGHVGLKGNTLADIAAKSVSSLEVSRLPLFFRDSYPVIRLFTIRSWQGLWDQQVGNKLSYLKPHIGLSKSSMRSNRREEFVLTCLRIRHCRLTHRFLLSGDTAPDYGTCNVPLKHCSGLWDMQCTDCRTCNVPLRTVELAMYL